MIDWILQYEQPLRLSCFLSVFLLVALWEYFKPRRQLQISKSLRWFNNMALVVLNTWLLRLLFPILAVDMAIFASEQGWGMFNYWQFNPYLEIILSIVLLDMAVYFQHVLFHAVPVFWRLHRLHHSDLDYDVTTGTRFHPIEIMLSMLIKLAVVIVLGASPVAVLLFEIILNATAMFNHGNVYLPSSVDKVLRYFLVTPDMHRVHHSIEYREANSNFGFNLPWWDYLFGTYQAQAKKSHTEMTIGIDLFRDKRYLKIHCLLIQPFLDKNHGYSIRK